MKSYLKLSADGVNGSGKTCTIAQLACGLAKEYSEGVGTVHVIDTSDRWPAWKARIFDVEKVPIVITAGTSIAALQFAMEQHLRDKGSVFVADDLTVPWQEGVEAFAYENGALPFDRRQQLVNEWNKFVRPFQTGAFDALACGRLGYHWENVEDEETGELKLIQGDSKFNAGGGTNFAYDCILELEMRRRKRRLTGWIRGKTSVEYLCDVVKDANGVINGKQFIFQDFADGYKPGDYRKVLDVFRPHIEFRRKLTPSQRFDGSSRDLIVSGKTSWAKDQSERKSLLEELDCNLSMCFPSGEGKSKLAKMFRDLTLEYLNGYISWSRMEDEQTTPVIERNVLIVKAIRKRIEGGEVPTDHGSLAELLNLSRQDVESPGKHVTLMEAMGMKSIAHVQAKKGIAVAS
jgi:hypothetical protein